MAVFSNQATLNYNGISTNSNIAYGEILDVLSVSKTAINESYTPGSTVTYAVSLRSTGTAALSGLTVTDDLGGYEFDDTTVYPLSYIDGSATLFVNGVLQPAPTVTAEAPLTITGISIPAGGSAVLIYQAQVTEFADPSDGGTITNTASVSGGGISTPIEDSETIGTESEAVLSISKSISPTQVTDNDRVTYTFVIRNSGTEEVVATDNAFVSDTFDPIVQDLVVTFEGETWTEGVQYNYDEATGVFTTVPGRLPVPAATVVRDPETGAYSVVPGTVTLTVTGTI